MENNRRLFIICILIFLSFVNNYADNRGLKIGILKYRGGDWYSCIKGVRNFIKHLKEKTPVVCNDEPVIVDPSNSSLFNCPFIVLNGHGKILLNAFEKSMLKKYLLNGGFLLVNDDYGLDKYFRKLIKELFPDENLMEIPLSHKIFKSYYNFNFLPKIHKHDGKRPQIFGLFIKKRALVLYIYESDIIDGWEKKNVHNLSLEKRENAIKFGINILYYILSGQT